MTNVIKRKKNKLDFILIKTIIFDKRLKDKDNCIFLRKRTIQINKTANVTDLKNKIIRCINKATNKENNEKNCNIYFYTLNKDNKNVLMEMCISFVNNINVFDCLYTKKLKISENDNISKLLSSFDRKTNILITEIQYNNNSSFIKEINGDKYICTVCKKEIKSLNDIYKCNICHLSLFCSEKCANEKNEHKSFDEIYKKKYFVEGFNLKKFLKKNLLSLFNNNDNCKKGLVGLENLGNTCYMNSSLQCLSNTEDLTKYFLMKLFQNDINSTNKFAIVSKYYNLIYKMWYGNEEKIAPKSFLNQFTKNNTSFSGNKQQDAQEFLSKLLDDLHEDLNPSDNKSNSIINDLFNGKFKSEITCQECKNSSVSYQPFKFLSLSIPKKNKHYIFKIFCDSKCIKLDFEMSKVATLSDLKSRAMEVIKKQDPPLQKIKDLEICKIGSDYLSIKKFYVIDKTKKNDQKLETLLEDNNEIILFGREMEENKDYIRIIIFSGKEETENNKAKIKAISYPTYFYVKADISFKTFYEMFIERLKLSNEKDIIKPKKLNQLMNLCVIHKGNNKCKYCNQKSDIIPYCSIFSIKEKNKLREYITDDLNLIANSRINKLILFYENSPPPENDPSLNNYYPTIEIKDLMSSFNENEILQ